MTNKNLHVSTNLGSIHISVSGHGPAMFFWPSLMMESSMWEQQAEFFNKDYQVILIDGPGHGNSEALSRYFTIEECALCLSQIMDHLKIDRGIVVGNSWGGMMGSVFAALYPQRTIATVLMNCTASMAPIGQRVEYRLLGLIAKNFNKMPKFFVSKAIKAFVGGSTEKNRESVIGTLANKLSQVNIKSVRWAIQSVVVNRQDQHELIKQIKSPALIIAGKEDRIFPVLETKRMANVISGSQFEVLDEVGHSAAIENPQLVNKKIESFLNSLKNSN